MMTFQQSVQSWLAVVAAAGKIQGIEIKTDAISSHRASDVWEDYQQYINRSDMQHSDVKAVVTLGRVAFVRQLLRIMQPSNAVQPSSHVQIIWFPSKTDIMKLSTVDLIDGTKKAEDEVRSRATEALACLYIAFGAAPFQARDVIYKLSAADRSEVTKALQKVLGVAVAGNAKLIGSAIINLRDIQGPVTLSVVNQYRTNEAHTYRLTCKTEIQKTEVPASQPTPKDHIVEATVASTDRYCPIDVKAPAKLLRDLNAVAELLVSKFPDGFTSEGLLNFSKSQVGAAICSTVFGRVPTDKFDFGRSIVQLRRAWNGTAGFGQWKLVSHREDPIRFQLYKGLRPLVRLRSEFGSEWFGPETALKRLGLRTIATTRKLLWELEDTQDPELLLHKKSQDNKVKYRVQNRDPSAVKSVAQVKIKTVEPRHCKYQQCGQPFTPPTGSYAVYCSVACRVMAEGKKKAKSESAQPSNVITSSPLVPTSPASAPTIVEATGDRLWSIHLRLKMLQDELRLEMQKAHEGAIDPIGHSVGALAIAETYLRMALDSKSSQK
jgi:hypothetical protein